MIMILIVSGITACVRRPAATPEQEIAAALEVSKSHLEFISKVNSICDNHNGLYNISQIYKYRKTYVTCKDSISVTFDGLLDRLE
jgi:hypothetical protein